MSKNFTAIKVLCCVFDCISSHVFCFCFVFRPKKKEIVQDEAARGLRWVIHSKHKLAFNLNGITWRNNLRFSCRPNDVVVDALPATVEALPATTGDQEESEEGVAVAARLQACADWSGSSSTAQQSGSTSRPATPAEERHQSILSSHVTKIQIPDTDILYIDSQMPLIAYRAVTRQVSIYGWSYTHLSTRKSTTDLCSIFVSIHEEFVSKSQATRQLTHL